MKTTKPIIVFIFLLWFQVAEAQQKFSKIKIRLPQSAAERSAVIAMMEADHFNAADDGIIAEISENAQKNLKSI